MCSFVNKSAPFSVQIDNIWELEVTDVAFTPTYVTWCVGQWRVHWVLVLKCSKGDLILFLGGSLPWQRNPSTCLEPRSTEIAGGNCPSHPSFRVAKILGEQLSEIQYKFRLSTVAQHVTVNYLKLPVNSVRCAFTSVFINNVFFSMYWIIQALTSSSWTTPSFFLTYSATLFWKDQLTYHREISRPWIFHFQHVETCLHHNILSLMLQQYFFPSFPRHSGSCPGNAPQHNNQRQYSNFIFVSWLCSMTSN